MTSQVVDYNTYIEKLRKIEEIDWVKFELSLNERPNFWSIIEYGEKVKKGGRSSHEERMSRMIRWLMDPNETHHLGNIFIVQLLKLINVKYPYSPYENKQIHVDAEYDYIDVLYRDYENDVFLAIELKQYAKEGKRNSGKSQLVHYDDVLQHLASENTQVHRIFLTPAKDHATREEWVPVGYEQFIEIMRRVLEEALADPSIPYREETVKILKDFKDELQRIYYIKNRDPRKIRQPFTPEERKFTRQLVTEINGEAERKHIDELIKENDGKIENMETLLLFIGRFIHTQDHTTSEESMILMRKIYNYFTAGEQLPLDVSMELPEEKRISKLDREITDEHELRLETLELTSTGQGIHMRPNDTNYRIYFSSNGKGEFPGAYIHLGYMKGDKEKIKNSTIVKNQSFQVNSELIIDDKIMDENGDIYDIVELIEDHIIPAIAELDEFGQEITSPVIIDESPKRS